MKWVALATGLLVLAGCTSSPTGSPAPIQSAASSPSSQQPMDAGSVAEHRVGQATAAGPLPAFDASGPVSPRVWPASVLKGSGLAVSTRPFLTVPDNLRGKDFRFEIFDISAGQDPEAGSPLAQANAGRAWEVPADLLVSGRQYAWRARPADQESGDWAGPFTVDVDTMRPSLAPRDQIGGVSTHLLTGAALLTWMSRSFPTVHSNAFAVLEYASTQGNDPALPAGWRLSLPLTSRWTTFTPSEGENPSSVYVADADGRSLTFTRNDGGVYVQTWANGRKLGAADSGALRRVGDTWQLTEVNGDITQFEGNRPTSFTSNGMLVGTSQWTKDGRIAKVTDPSGRSIAFSYGRDCPTAEGFSAAQDGMLCGIAWWDGTSTSISYVDSADGPRVGLIADAIGGSGPVHESGLGLGWDAAGRLAAVRQPLVNAAVASGVIDRSARDVLTEISYDEQGRVRAIAAPAPEPGAERLVHAYDYPAISQDMAGDNANVTARVQEAALTGSLGEAQPRPLGSVLGDGRLFDITVKSADWRPIERRDRDGATTTMTWDAMGRRIDSVTDYEGRTTTYSYDEGRRSGFAGPATVADEAFRQSSVVDTNPDGERLLGLAAQYWSSTDGLGTVAGGGWIARSGEVAESWTTSPTGGQGWSARFTGLWTLPGKDTTSTWAIDVDADEATTALYVDNRPCDTSGGPCRLELSGGEHVLRIDMAVSSGAGNLRVGAMAVGSGRLPDRLPVMRDVAPNFGLTTKTTTNDRFGDGQVMQTQTQYAEPWTGQPTQMETPGGLITQATYEPTGAQGWGRKLTGSTPGGMVTHTDYWPLSGSKETSPCERATPAEQAGQPRTITRSDGVQVQRWYDAAGRTVAIRTGGAKGELACWSYASDGSLVASQLRSTDGSVVESTDVVLDVDGDPRRTRTTVATTSSLVPASSVTETSVDLLGRLTTYRDLSGVTFSYEYDVQGNQIARTASLDGKRLVRSEQTFDEQTGRPAQMFIDGELMATVAYDGRGRVHVVSYASGAEQSYHYLPNGTVDVTAIDVRGGGSITDATVANVAGRVQSRQTQVKGLGELNTNRQWSYAYDSAARLRDAELDTSGSLAGVGAAHHLVRYGFGEPDSSCPKGASDPGADLNRTSGKRDGTSYVTCYDAAGHVVSTTDPLLAPRGGAADLSWDALGRLVRSQSKDASLEIAWTWAGMPETITDRTGSEQVVTTLAHALGRLIAQASDDSSSGGAAVRMAYANPTALAPSVIVAADGVPLEVRLLLPGGALWHKTLATGDVLVDHPGIRGEVIVRTDGRGAVVPGPGGGALAEALGPYGEPLNAPRASADASGTPPSYGYGFARLEPTMPGGAALVLSVARPYLPALGAYIAFDPEPGSSTTGYGYAEADPVNFSDPTGAYSWWDFARNVLAVVAITASIMCGPGCAWWGVLAISMLTSGAQLGLTALERDAKGQTLTTTDFVMEVISVGLDMAIMGAGKAKSAWKAKSELTQSVVEASDELTSSSIKLATAPANESVSLTKALTQATLTVAGFQLLLGGGGQQQATGPQGAEQQGQGDPGEEGAVELPTREGQHRVPDRL